MSYYCGQGAWWIYMKNLFHSLLATLNALTLVEWLPVTTDLPLLHMVEILCAIS